MNITKNTRYCFFSLKHYCYYFLAFFPFSLSTWYYQLPFLLWYKATGFISTKKKNNKGQLDYMHADVITSLEHECAKAGPTMHSYHCCCCREKESWAALCSADVKNINNGKCQKVSIFHLYTPFYLFLRLRGTRCINHFKRRC